MVLTGVRSVIQLFMVAVRGANHAHALWGCHSMLTNVELKAALCCIARGQLGHSYSLIALFLDFVTDARFAITQDTGFMLMFSIYQF